MRDFFEICNLSNLRNLLQEEPFGGLSVYSVQWPEKKVQVFRADISLPSPVLPRLEKWLKYIELLLANSTPSFHIWLISGISTLSSSSQISQSLQAGGALGATFSVALVIWASTGLQPWRGRDMDGAWWCYKRVEHGMAQSWGLVNIFCHMAMNQYLLIPFLGGWKSIYQLFWCSPGVQGFDTLPHSLHCLWCLWCLWSGELARFQGLVLPWAATDSEYLQVVQPILEDPQNMSSLSQSVKLAKKFMSGVKKCMIAIDCWVTVVRSIRFNKNIPELEAMLWEGLRWSLFSRQGSWSPGEGLASRRLPWPWQAMASPQWFFPLSFEAFILKLERWSQVSRVNLSLVFAGGRSAFLTKEAEMEFLSQNKAS